MFWNGQIAGDNYELSLESQLNLNQKTHSITAHSRILLVVSRLIRKFPPFYGTQIFIPIFEKFTWFPTFIEDHKFIIYLVTFLCGRETVSHHKFSVFFPGNIDIRWCKTWILRNTKILNWLISPMYLTTNIPLQAT